ncbi:MAG: sigma-70 family RNA polymerase sigma factor [Sandaracinaceae bacterium]|nr:sigma-70 family RNA polymerase sigma factor [Sandaracinaceae bacterium]
MLDVPTPSVEVAARAAPARTESWTRADFQHHVEPHLPRLYRLCLTLARNAPEAEDLLQNALVKAYLHRASFEGRGSLIAWLYGIVRHEHIELARTAQRRRGLLESALAHATDLLGWWIGEGQVEQSAEDTMIAQEESEVLLSCLRAIREPFRTTVFLCDVEELAYEEVARITGAALGTVKSRHARGRAMLREAFERRERRVNGEEAER